MVTSTNDKKVIYLYKKLKNIVNNAQWFVFTVAPVVFHTFVTVENVQGDFVQTAILI